jgi:hypothetical protein
MQTKKSDFTEDAKAATKEEILDHCSIWVPKAMELARRDNFNMLVSWDNASIHPNTQQELTRLGLTQQQLIGPPANSPDFHELIEHRFGEVKEGLVTVIYKFGFDKVNSRVVADAVKDLCCLITPAKVAADIPQQIFAYRVVAAPEDVTLSHGHKSYKGTFGGYGPRGVR